MTKFFLKLRRFRETSFSVELSQTPLALLFSYLVHCAAVPPEHLTPRSQLITKMTPIYSTTFICSFFFFFYKTLCMEYYEASKFFFFLNAFKNTSFKSIPPRSAHMH